MVYAGVFVHVVLAARLFTCLVRPVGAVGAVDYNFIRHLTSHSVSLSSESTLYLEGLMRHLTCNDTPIHVATFTYLLQRYPAN